MTARSVLRAFIAYIDRDLNRLNTAHEALSKIPKRKRTADDKARLAAVGDEIHITTTHVTMLESFIALDKFDAEVKRTPKMGARRPPRDPRLNDKP